MNGMCLYEAPFGNLWIKADDRGITEIKFDDGRRQIPGILYETPHIKEAVRQLDEYFAGKRRVFELALSEYGTEFQKKVWKALRDIPYGETRSYAQIAAVAGNPKASRAVGMANNRNPIPIVTPCHRVIGADGKMVGYGGGLDKKEFLLALEKNNK